MSRSGLRASADNWLRESGRLLRAGMLGVALAGGAAAVAGCSANEAENDGSVRGTLAVYIARMDDGSSRTEYRLQVDGNEADERTLVFGKTPDLPSGSELKVWGDAAGREIIVRSFEVVDVGSADGIGTSQEAIIGGSAYPARTFAFVLVDVGEGVETSQGDPYTEAQATIDIFGTGA